MLLFALNTRDGKLANDWRPQFVDLPPWEEVQLPEAPDTWKWSAASGPVDIYVLFLHPGSTEARELKTLVMAMLNPNIERRVLERQTVKLRELATRSGVISAEMVYVAKVTRVELAATYRGASFPWQRHASAANFSKAMPGLLIFRVDDSKPARSEAKSEPSSRP